MDETSTDAEQIHGLLHGEMLKVVRFDAIATAICLGEGDVGMSAKRLFCLCAGSPRYTRLISSYEGALAPLTLTLTTLAALLLSMLACFCCGCKDNARYYDPELL